MWKLSNDDEKLNTKEKISVKNVLNNEVSSLKIFFPCFRHYDNKNVLTNYRSLIITLSVPCFSLRHVVVYIKKHKKLAVDKFSLLQKELFTSL